MVNWKRPLTLIYKDNHSFGTALYEPTLGECERRFVGSSRTVRPDIGGFGESSILGAAIAARSPTGRAGSSRPKSLHEDLFEQRQSSRARSVEREERARTPRRQISRQDSGRGAGSDLRAEIEQLQERIAEHERSARQDASVLRDIMGSRMVEMATMLRDAEAHNAECQKIIRKQSQLMADVQNYCQGLERKLANTIDELAVANNKCKSLYGQIESLRE